MRIVTVLFLCFANIICTAQSVQQTLNDAFNQLSKDTALRKASVSFCMLNNKNGQVIFEKNKNELLAPASTLKTFITAAALHTLGENFQYKTRVSFKGVITNKIAYGTLMIYGSGDPSLGSDRYDNTKPDVIYKQILNALKSKGIQKIVGNMYVVKNIFNDNNINAGWLDEDIGNYYGAGIYSLNWKENKFEINLVPTKTSFEVSTNTAGYDNRKDFCIELVHKEGATTEEAFAFVEKAKPCKYNIKGVLSNKEPVQNMQLARLTPEADFVRDLTAFLKKEKMFESGTQKASGNEIEITVLSSPPLSKLVYWCNQKSLNLYAESFCKTIAAQLFRHGNWTLGISAMMRYASQFGVDVKKVKLLDACGLAPENKITTYILASLLQKATTQKTYPVFYESLPSINGLIMKSGYIGGTRSYAGYIKLKDSTDASFAFIVHNYTCTPKEMKLKMFQVLDKLK